MRHPSRPVLYRPVQQTAPPTTNLHPRGAAAERRKAVSGHRCPTGVSTPRVRTLLFVRARDVCCVLRVLLHRVPYFFATRRARVVVCLRTAEANLRIRRLESLVRGACDGACCDRFCHFNGPFIERAIATAVGAANIFRVL